MKSLRIQANGVTSQIALGSLRGELKRREQAPGRQCKVSRCPASQLRYLSIRILQGRVLWCAWL
jgi:hypothetical protein